jgi:hypothetical protein
MKMLMEAFDHEGIVLLEYTMIIETHRPPRPVLSPLNPSKRVTY